MTYEQFNSIDTNWLWNRCPADGRPADHYMTTVVEGVTDYTDEVIVKVTWVFASRPKGRLSRLVLSVVNPVLSRVFHNPLESKGSQTAEVSRTAVLLPVDGVLKIVQNRTGLRAMEIYGIVRRNAGERTVRMIPELI